MHPGNKGRYLSEERSLGRRPSLERQKRNKEETEPGEQSPGRQGQTTRPANGTRRQDQTPEPPTRPKHQGNRRPQTKGKQTRAPENFPTFEHLSGYFPGCFYDLGGQRLRYCLLPCMKSGYFPLETGTSRGTIPHSPPCWYCRLQARERGKGRTASFRRVWTPTDAPRIFLRRHSGNPGKSGRRGNPDNPVHEGAIFATSHLE